MLILSAVSTVGAMVSPTDRTNAHNLETRANSDARAASDPRSNTAEVRAPFTGRTKELAVIVQGIREARTQNTMVLIEGAAGIGKSALTDRCVQLAMQAGFVPYVARATPESSDRPFAPLLDAFSLDPFSIDGAPSSTVGPNFGSEPASPAFPHERLGAVFAIAADRRYQVIDFLCAHIEALTLRSPVLLVIEDVHAAESSTVIALRSLRKRLEGLPLLIVVTSRPVTGGSELARSLHSLEEIADSVVLLGPLSVEHCSEIAELIKGSALNEHEVSLLTVAAGNPLMTRELMRTRAMPSDVPSSLNDAIASSIGSRYRMLTQQEKRILCAAAALGTEFSIEDAAFVGEVEVADVVRALTSAENLDIVSLQRDTTCRFVHDLIRDGVRDLTSTNERSKIHDRAATRVADNGGSAVVVAWHLSERDANTPVDLLVNDRRSWLIQAAREASGQAPAIASRLFLEALHDVPFSDPNFHDLRIELLAQLASAGLTEEAKRQGHGLLESNISMNQELAVRWWLGSVLFVNNRLDEALALTSPAQMNAADAMIRARLTALTALVQAVLLDPKFVENVRIAEEIGREVDDPSALALVSVLSARHAANELDIQKGIALSEEGVRVADRDPNGFAHRYQPLFFLALRLLDAVDGEGMQRILSRGRMQSDRCGTSWAESLYCSGEAVLAAREYRLDDALAHAHAALAIADDTGVHLPSIVARSSCALVYLHRNDTASAAEELERAEAIAAKEPLRWGTDLLVMVRTRLLYAEGKCEEALRFALDSASLFVAVGYRQAALDALGVALEASNGLTARLDDQPIERNLIVPRATIELLQQSFHAIVAGIEENDVRRSEGTVAYARSLWILAHSEATSSAWINAIRATDASCWLSDRAQIRLAALRWSFATNDRKFAQTIVDEIDALNLPMRPAEHELVHSARVVAKRKAGRPSRTKDGFQILSPTERSIARAIAEGKSNRSIAIELDLSVRTVESHVSSVLRKLELKSRVHVAISMKAGSRK
jgi:DNA-binding CsgD family transcriptional regulator/tetratricopeptide (TPR) repeat protein